jgi:hypothetical protein
MIYTPEKIQYIKWKFAQSNKLCFAFLVYIAFYKIICKIKKVYNRVQLFAWETKVYIYLDELVVVPSLMYEYGTFRE